MQEPPGQDVLRVLVATDNHLGYKERDPIRGKDSFAAFEEIILLAKQHKVDFVLLGGDLFHENKPSQRTLYRTMDILRRYCMGPEPVRFQVISEQAQNFGDRFGHVNYEDPFFKVGLPLFSIHGNHDDPNRDGGVEAFSALDLLHVANLVNYFGKNEKVDDVEVNPILLQKGATKVALYGMGNMRDERLNRMWEQKKVKFLRPSEGDGGRDFFNIFVIHQNRDFGLNLKNCISESMIPKWMDLVIWGHEHQCKIDPVESLAGTFRVSQPGSSVVTSLTSGEAVPKMVGVLEVREKEFHMTPVPLSQVRPFKMGEVVLSEVEGLDSKGANVDEAVGEVLADKVKEIVKELVKEDEGMRREPPGGQKYLVEKRDQVLVRLRVEHSEFPTLNNQRFGSQFIGEVANPSNLLRFYRQRNMSGSGFTTAGGITASAGGLDDVRVKDLVMENLERSTAKLSLLVESKLNIAMEDYVHKREAQAVNDLVKERLETVQNDLMKQKAAGNTAMIDGAVAKISEKEKAKVEAERLRNKPSKASSEPVRREDAGSRQPDAADKGDRDRLNDEHDDKGIVSAALKQHGKRNRRVGAGAKSGDIRNYFVVPRTGGRRGEQDNGGVGDDLEIDENPTRSRSSGLTADVVSRRSESRGTSAFTDRNSGGKTSSAWPRVKKGRVSAISATGSGVRGIVKVDIKADVDEGYTIQSGRKGDEIEVSDDDQCEQKDVSVQQAPSSSGTKTMVGAKPASRPNGTSMTSAAYRQRAPATTVSRTGKRGASGSPRAEDAAEAAQDARGGGPKRRLPSWASGSRRDEDL